MTTHSKTIIHTDGEFTIIRWKIWGFRSDSKSTSWQIQNNRTGEDGLYFYRLRDAKAEVARLSTPLRERLCTPVTVGQAGEMLAASY